MIRRIVSYPRSRWCRGDAWHNLNAQQFPGAPFVLLRGDPTADTAARRRDLWVTSWRKSHTGRAWRWYADACEHGNGNPRTCEQCQDDEMLSRDWLGLRDDLQGGP